MGFIPCIEHSSHNLLTKDIDLSVKFPNVNAVVHKIKITHRKLAFRTDQLRCCYEETQREDVANYLKEWDENLKAAMDADEQLSFDISELTRLGFEQQLLAEAGQESFTTFKSFTVTRWYSLLTMIQSYDKNHGEFFN